MLTSNLCRDEEGLRSTIELCSQTTQKMESLTHELVFI